MSEQGEDSFWFRLADKIITFIEDIFDERWNLFLGMSIFYFFLIWVLGFLLLGIFEDELLFFWPIDIGNNFSTVIRLIFLLLFWIPILITIYIVFILIYEYIRTENRKILWFLYFTVIIILGTGYQVLIELFIPLKMVSGATGPIIFEFFDFYIYQIDGMMIIDWIPSNPVSEIFRWVLIRTFQLLFIGGGVHKNIVLVAGACIISSFLYIPIFEKLSLLALKQREEEEDIKRRLDISTLDKFRNISRVYESITLEELTSRLEFNNTKNLMDWLISEPVDQVKFIIKEKKIFFTEHKKKRNLPFFCQLDQEKHPSTNSAYICLDCSRTICENCFENISAVGVPDCPYCDGELIKVQ